MPTQLTMQTIKDILEIIYFISGPIIAFFAFKALSQIKEARNQVTEARNSRILHAKRDSYKIAAEKCTYYMETIIPLISHLDDSVKEKKITFFSESKVIIEGGTYKTYLNFSSDEERDKVLSLEMYKVFNPIESFSLFFTSGVADEQIGFLSVGHTFCYSIKKYLPILVFYSRDNEHYNNIISLFSIWNSRIEKEKLENEKKKIEKELSKNQQITIKPIGTE